MRYWLKLTEAKYPWVMLDFVKQKSDLEYYNECFFKTVHELGIRDFKFQYELLINKKSGELTEEN